MSVIGSQRRGVPRGIVAGGHGGGGGSGPARITAAALHRDNLPFVLLLPKCHLTSEHCCSAVLMTLRSLTQNSIGAAGCSSLAEALAVNSSLRHLA